MENKQHHRGFVSGNITTVFRKSKDSVTQEDLLTCSLQKEQKSDKGNGNRISSVEICSDNFSDSFCLENLFCDENCTVVTADGNVSLNLALLCCCSPNLKSILSEYCGCDQLCIILPWAQKSTIDTLLKLVLTGCASNVRADELDNITHTLRILDLSIDISVSIQDNEVEEASEQVVVETFVAPCYDVDDDVVSIVSNEVESGFINTVHSCIFKKSNQTILDGININKYCCKSCSSNCGKVVEGWSPAMLSKVKSEVSKRTIVKVKESLLEHLKAQDNIGGVKTNKFQFHGHKFCSSYFSYMTGLSKYLIDTVLKDYSKGVRIYEHGNAGISKIQPSTVGFITWMKGFAEWYGQYSPTEEKIILSYWLRKGVLYSIYVEEAPGPHIASSTFYQYFETYFGPNRVDKSLPCVQISKYSSHSVCNICLALNNSRRLAKTELDLKIAKSLINQHKLIFGEAFRKVQEIKQAAISHPQDHLLIQVDGMNNFTSYVPRYQIISKEMQGSERLPSKITGCILWSGLYEDKRKIMFYVNHDQVIFFVV